MKPLVLPLLALGAILIAQSSAESASSRGIVKPVGKIAFDHVTSGESSGPSDIYVVNAGGGNVRNLTHDPTDDLDPAWSPDGRKIAFVSYRCSAEAQACSSTIHLMNADGSGQRSVTRNEPGRSDRDPAWSPASKIAFVRTSNEAVSSAIWVMNADGSGQRRITRDRRGRSDRAPAWSPDGTTLALVRGNDIWLMDANGRHQRRLVRNGCCPTWSPDAATIAFERNHQIWVMAASGRNQRRLVNRGGGPAWSPDGRYIAFARQPGIWVVNADGSRQRRLRRVSFIEVGDPAWSPR
jgi:Tol biopolymer transport system component